ncbi:MAG: thioredoxin domain-containing protein, partial [Marinomonas sp.]
DPALKLYYVPSGQVSVEVRHVIRDPIDWTAAVLTNCGEPSKFAQNHALFMGEQPKWLEEARSATTGQKQRWSNPNRILARKAIATDLGFDELMIRRGYSRVDIDRCLSDNEAATRLVIQSMEEAKRMNVEGTPSFAIDDTLLEGTHSWQPLQMRVDAALTAKRTQ